ncbi:hypothetical protein Q9L42_021025 (plasmid) [Methylomarinum sp. Ch1-1]|uniref:Uncharacterized protein n=1 Tax=Methylomarinum roseum TaxID=3067653 RepID=A0AAU7P0M3_9GAMM|nr:hypothetical protein [Methylomarinum sp. Ch1-1]MDP4519008.1 hypothetical protein [Methylomarinum sp. Ch1-1]
MFKKVVGFLFAPYRDAIEHVKKRSEIPVARDSFDLVTEKIARTKQRYSDAKGSMISASNFEADFSICLREWGVVDKQISDVIKNMSIEIVVYLVILGVCVFSLINSVTVMTVASVVSTSLIFVSVLITRLYKISVLKNRQYIPFSTWIRSKV